MSLRRRPLSVRSDNHAAFRSQGLTFPPPDIPLKSPEEVDGVEESVQRRAGHRHSVCGRGRDEGDGLRRQHVESFNGVFARSVCFCLCFLVLLLFVRLLGSGDGITTRSNRGALGGLSPEMFRRKFQPTTGHGPNSAVAYGGDRPVSRSKATSPQKAITSHLLPRLHDQYGRCSSNSLPL